MAVATIHAVAAGLAAASTSTMAGASALTIGTTALALTRRVVSFALAGRDDGRKERRTRGLDGRVATSSTGRRIVATSSTGRIVTFAFARRVVTLALAPASALSFAALTLAFALASSKFLVLDEDVVAATYRLAFDDASGTIVFALTVALTLTIVLRLLHGGILSREGIELPAVDVVAGMELDGIVGGHITMMLICLIGIGRSRSAEEMGDLLGTVDEDTCLGFRRR